MSRMIAAALALLLSVPPAAAQPPAPDSDAMLREHLWHQVRSLPVGERPRVGLVLSAGAVRGIAHIGVIQVLEDAGFPIDVVAGTSMGAVIGSMYAAGLDMKTLRSFPDHLTLSSGSNFNTIRLFRLLINDSLMSTKNFEKVLHSWIGDKKFHETLKPFACVAMDLRTGEKIIFRDGPLAPAVRASMNLPGLFAPVQYRHRYLVDGGVVDFIPVDAARLLGAEWIIASVTEADFTKERPTNVLSTMMQIFDIRGSILSRQQREEADIVIEPDVSEIVYYDVSRGDWVMEQGMIAAKASITRAKDALILRTLPGLWKRWNPKS
ncbi:MAG: patatin-like phospholipase family protein [Elusimicrobiota bacterium]